MGLDTQSDLVFMHLQPLLLLALWLSL